eukprot:NODE_2_length_4816_cov_86.193203_g1_i0.p1 GENE.NODE_2_length_4816_cov_86.193203_g1_i0~~NODE_2_length_4816_cov_86.193203_g1_i0.p1  ORF type:complete len:914 (-),score=107.04 NODE_2_length_4816_cov_86.193203_g1_i0:357-3098(-)
MNTISEDPSHANVFKYASLGTDGHLLFDTYKDKNSAWSYTSLDHCRCCGLQDDYCSCEFAPHSGIVNDAAVMKMPTTTQENMQFTDLTTDHGYAVLSEIDPTRRLQDSNDASLENFFSRPVKIADIPWETSTDLDLQTNPWNLYFGNKRVINRLANFKLLRAKLRLKIVINGNSFHYGRAIVAYKPLADFDEIAQGVAYIPKDLVQLSQLPHIYLDPTTSSGGDMELPFFWPLNYLDIPDSSWGQMGQLYIKSINPLKHANGATDKVTISVFAWAEDVNMSGLTSQNPTQMTPQMGDEIDTANKDGIVSGPATTVAKVSNAMCSIPPLKPFAMATSTVATAVASAARVFGYSRPPVTANPSPYRPTPISHLAATTVPDTALKLSVDDKQELSIDPRIAGLGSADPMSIKEIAKRESYLTTFTWSNNDNPESLLFNSRVTPVLWNESNDEYGDLATAFHFPACAMAALPFKYWTGTINFRFQFVCSGFHKGRVRIAYDPDFITGSEYNVNYMEIVDLAEKNDFTISIGNGQVTTLLDRHIPGLTDVDAIFSSANRINSDGAGNGTIGMFVVNELTTPNSEVDNDIEVNVFISAGDDFEVFVPDSHFQSFVLKPSIPDANKKFKAQSGEEPGGTLDESSAPLQSTSTNVGPGMQDNTLTNMVYTGESIMSFRTMLKRYSLHRRQWIGPNNGMYRMFGTRNMFPLWRGATPQAQDTSIDGKYDYVNTLLLHWVVAAHQGWRGGIRTKMLPKHRTVSYTTDPTSGPGISDVLSSSLYVERVHTGDGTNGVTTVAQNFTGNDNANQCAWDGIKNFINEGNSVARPTGFQGMLYADDNINGAAEFESPFYSNFRFVPGKVLNFRSGTNISEGYQFDLTTFGGKGRHVDFHHAIAEDFQVYFWTGLPRMYYEVTPPSPGQ